MQKLSNRYEGTLNDKEVSEIIEMITGADVYKDLLAVYYNQKGSKDFPINSSSVGTIKKLLAAYHLEVKDLPYKENKKK